MDIAGLLFLFCFLVCDLAAYIEFMICIFFSRKDAKKERRKEVPLPLMRDRDDK